jgi:hypothetical protein
LDHSSDFETVHGRLSVSFYHWADWTNAEYYARGALKLQPGDPAGRIILAWLAAKTEQPHLLEVLTADQEAALGPPTGLLNWLRTGGIARQ